MAASVHGTSLQMVQDTHLSSGITHTGSHIKTTKMTIAIVYSAMQK